MIKEYEKVDVTNRAMLKGTRCNFLAICFIEDDFDTSIYGYSWNGVIPRFIHNNRYFGSGQREMAKKPMLGDELDVAEIAS